MGRIWLKKVEVANKKKEESFKGGNKDTRRKKICQIKNAFP